MYEVRLLDAAARDLKRLDAAIARRIVQRLTWLGAHFEDVPAMPLKGDLAGLFKFRVGDYRIIYEPLHEERRLLVHFVGHRSEVYRR